MIATAQQGASGQVCGRRSTQQAHVRCGTVHIRANTNAHRVWLAAPLVWVLQARDVLLHALVPDLVVALVERVDLALLGDLHLALRQHELADSGVKGEDVDALADCDHKDRGGGVEDVAGAAEAVAGLADVEDAVLHHRVGVVHV